MKNHIAKMLLVGAAVAWSRIASAQGSDGPPPGPPPSVDDYGGWQRLSLMYSPELELGNSSLGQALNRASAGDGVHNLGIETSTQTGWYARHHAQLDFTYGYGFSGIRLEPLGFGWAFPIIKTRSVSFEIEPLISLLDGMLLFSNDAYNNSNVTFLLGSGAEVQANLVLGPIYFFASPFGVELRYLEITSGRNGEATTGLDALWRFRGGIGVQY